ncbi:hypothetical protein RYH73_23600 [Olivibacter sp. CPCC 100613]|uniref:hypothetical protein n=1 Tax=Olivibacter sp. CPCC 100613 TaxID=3079931 RepID=UPI002FF78BF9
MKYTLIKEAEELRFLTVKAVKCIAKAELLIIDSTITDEIFNFASINCHIVHLDVFFDYLSTCKGSFPGNIVRLCNNETSIVTQDEMVIRYLKQIGYQLLIIPGINMVNRIAGQNHFPLTIRNRNESFWVCDARFFCQSGKEPIEKLHSVAASNATIAIKFVSIDTLKFMLTTINIYRHKETPVLITDFNNDVYCHTLMDINNGKLKEDQYKLIIVNPCTKMINTSAFSVEEVLEKRSAIG